MPWRAVELDNAVLLKLRPSVKLVSVVCLWLSQSVATMFPLSVVVCSLLALAGATDVQQCSGESLHKSIIARPAFVSAYIRRKYSCDMLGHNGEASVGLTASKLTAVRSVP